MDASLPRDRIKKVACYGQRLVPRCSSSTSEAAQAAALNFKPNFPPGGSTLLVPIMPYEYEYP
eukprot:scaffold369181_cov17-Prasinocladus_malaysianus.AAC.1